MTLGSLIPGLAIQNVGRTLVGTSGTTEAKSFLDHGALARLVRVIASSHAHRLPRTPSALGVIARALCCARLALHRQALLPNGSVVSDGAVLVAIIMPRRDLETARHSGVCLAPFHPPGVS